MWQQHSDSSGQLSLYFLYIFHIQLMVSHIFQRPVRLETQRFCAPGSCRIGHGTTEWYQEANKDSKNKFFSPSTWNQKELDSVSEHTLHYQWKSSMLFQKRRCGLLWVWKGLGKEKLVLIFQTLLHAMLLHVPHTARWAPDRAETMK